MRKLIVFLTVLSLIFLSVAPSVFAVYGNVGPTTEFSGDVGTTGVFKINGTQIAVGDVTGAAASGSNSDITELTGITTAIAPQYGGTGVLNNSLSTITITGSYPLEITIGASTAVTFPASGTLVADDVTSLSSLTTIGTVTTGGLGTGATLGNVTVNVTSAAANDILILGGSEVLTRLAPNSNADNRFLRTISSGVPSYESITFNDVGNSGSSHEIDFTTHSIEFSFDSGGEFQIGDGGATNYFQVDHAGVATFGGTGRLEIPAGDIDPATTAGDFVFDTDVANMTNGNPAIHDGTTIRYFITLAAAEIWTTVDELVVAYDATGDKFYLKVDATSGANYVYHMMDVDAADEEWYLNDDDTNDGDIWLGGQPQVAYARNITTTGGETNGSILVTGTSADGTVGAEDTIAIESGVTQGDVALMNITAMVVTGATNTFDVGMGDIIGLPNAFDTNTDIYMKTVDGADDFDQITGNVDTTNNTLDCGTIEQNEDITIYYHD